MELMFYGFVLLAFRFIGTERVQIGALLAIGAYYLISLGIAKVDKENPYFNKVKHLLYVLMALNGAFFIFAATRAGIGGMFNFAAFIIDIIVFVSLIQGIQVYTDKLIDKKQPIKLFKRWRMTYILIGSMVSVSIIMFILTFTALPWEQMPDFIKQLQEASTTNYQEVFNLSWNFFMPVMGMLVLWAILMFGLLVTFVIFKILFLVSMYKIQAEYALYLASNPQQELQ
ncbi:MAG: hypothetical protein FD133_1911 [Erysipelotrichaceae bacterium]|nr:MAG: hypothetical protein FD133_1911 [Erysipelotrichaceae bacterium]